MTTWTPKLKKLINDYADFEIKNSEDGKNPRQTVVGSLLRTAFRTAVTKNGRYNEVCKELGLDTKEYHKNIQTMIDLAKANNCDAADKLVATRAFWSAYAVNSKGGIVNDIRATVQVARNLAVLKRQQG